MTVGPQTLASPRGTLPRAEIVVSVTHHHPLQLSLDPALLAVPAVADRSRAAAAQRTDLQLSSISPHGVWTIPSAMRCGIPRQRIRGRIASGRWVLAAGHAYADRRHADDLYIRAAAAQLSLPDGLVWGRTAGLLHELPIEDDGVVHMAAPAGRNDAYRIVTHEVVVTDDPVEISGSWVTSRTETILDCLAVLPQRESHDLLAWVFTRELITQEEFLDGVEMRWYRPGVERLRTYAAMVARGALSAAEDRFHTVLNEAGITGWTANTRVWDRGRIVAVVDVLFASAKLAIEVDGAYAHTDPEKDRRRDAALRALGYTVLHFTWNDITRSPELVVDAILAALSVAA